jgi:hypothetical protein
MYQVLGAGLRRSVLDGHSAGRAPISRPSLALVISILTENVFNVNAKWMPFKTQVLSWLSSATNQLCDVQHMILPL